MSTKSSKTSEFSWSEASSGMTYFILTNNLNLVDMLSSGMIKPAAYYQKYYQDLGNECPNAIPLLALPPAADLVIQAVPEGEFLKPVLLELALDGLSGPSWVVNTGYKVRKARLSKSDKVVVQLVNGILPASLITVVHFRSVTDLGEFVARKYGNMDPDNSGLSFRCSSDLFAGVGHNIGTVLDLIRNTGKKIPQGDQAAVTTVDGIAGAIALLGNYASRETGFPLERYANLINGFLGIDDEGRQDSPDGPDPYAWFPVLLNLLPDGEKDEAATLSIERILCRTAIRKSIGIKPDDFSPETFLEEVVDELERDLKMLSVPNSETVVDQHRNAIRLLLDTRMGLAGMDDFFSSYPIARHPTLAALFLFLVENSPQNLLHTLNQYPNFPVNIRSLSLCLAGALHGHTRIENDARPGRRLSYILEMASVSHINKNFDSVRLPVFVQPATVTIKPGDGYEEQILSISGETLIGRRLVVPTGNKQSGNQ